MSPRADPAGGERSDQGSHAMDRYRERVADLSVREIFLALSGPTFELAVEIGAPFVKLPSGHGAVIRRATVITILEAGCTCGLLDPRRDRDASCRTLEDPAA